VLPKHLMTVIKKVLQLFRLNLKGIMYILIYFIFRITNTKVPFRYSVLPEINRLYSLLIAANGKLITWTKKYFLVIIPSGKLYIRRNPSSDILVFEQLFSGEEYKEVVRLFKQNFNSSTPCIIDAGCNVGYTSIYFKSVFKQVYLAVIEPDEDNLSVIEANFKECNISAAIFRGGVWSKDTFLELRGDFRGGNHWSLRVVESEKETKIKAYSMSTILKDCNFTEIDILKMDIEGSEKEVFSLNANISFLDITKCIAIEIHDEFNCRADILKILKEKGFKLTDYGELTIGINLNMIKTK
jgi:FkbM family methyltransferase